MVADASSWWTTAISSFMPSGAPEGVRPLAGGAAHRGHPPGGAAIGMKLLIAVVHSEDASATMDALNDRGISVTRFVSSGGFLQHKNVTLMSGIEDDRIEEVLGLIKENCRTRSEFMNPMPPLVEPGDFFVPYPVEVQVGGATVFIMNVDRFEKL